MDTFEQLLESARLRDAMGGGIDRNAELRTADHFKDMPGWLQQFEPYQIKAINEVVEAFETTDVVVLDAPTGAGKTVIAEAVRQILGMRGVYVCNTKSLQHQFLKDFGYSRVLKGRSNYQTLYGGQSEAEGGTDSTPTVSKLLDVTAADCTKVSSDDEDGCRWCHTVSLCPYEVAKRDALSASVAVLNTRYFLTEANGPGRFSRRDFVVVDEADTLESEIMGYSEFDVSPRQIRKYGLGEPKFITKPDAWLSWIATARAKLARNVIPQRLLADAQSDLEEIREWKSLKRLKEGLKDLEVGLSTGTWVYTGKSGRVSFKPVEVSSISPTVLWEHSKKWLLMSGSILSPKFLLEECLGLTGSWSYISMTSPFPVENRRIFYRPLATMNRKGITENGQLPELLAGLGQVLATHPDERVLLHTVSYELTDAVEKFIRETGRETYTYRDAAGREVALEQYKASPKSVLVAPSMDRGIDLPGELCRVVGVCRVPFPNLGDRQVSSRLHRPGGQTWYTIQTIRSIVQMTGRGVRNKDDYCTTYIFDKQFKTLWNKNRWLFPEWWREAVVWG